MASRKLTLAIGLWPPSNAVHTLKYGCFMTRGKPFFGRKVAHATEVVGLMVMYSISFVLIPLVAVPLTRLEWMRVLCISHIRVFVSFLLVSLSAQPCVCTLNL